MKLTIALFSCLLVFSSCTSICESINPKDYGRFDGEEFYSYDIDGTRIYIDLPPSWSNVCNSVSMMDYLIISKQLTVSDFIKLIGEDKIETDTVFTRRSTDIFEDYKYFNGDKVFIERWYVEKNKPEVGEVEFLLHVTFNSPRPGPVSMFTLTVETRKQYTNYCWEYSYFMVCKYKKVSLRYNGAML